jgi:integrase
MARATIKRKTKGTGSVRQLPSGKWQARATVDGKLTSIGSFDTKLDADAALRRMNRNIERGTYTPVVKGEAGEWLFGEWLDLWLDRRSKVLAPKTMYDFRNYARRFFYPHLGSIPLADLSKSTLDSFYWDVLPDDRPVQRERVYGNLRTILGDAVAEGLMPALSPAVRKSGKKARRKMKDPDLPTMEQLDILREALPDKWQAIVTLSVSCALRWGEVTALTTDDVDLRSRILYVRGGVTQVDGQWHHSTTKTGESRKLSIPKSVIADIKFHLDNFVDDDPATRKRGQRAPLLFPSVKDPSKPLAESTFADPHWKRATAEAKIPGFLRHDMRKVGATLYAQTGATIDELMDRLGHSSPQVAMLYQKRAQGRDRHLADAMFG